MPASPSYKISNLFQGSSVEALDKINAELFATVGDNGKISIWNVRKKSPVCSNNASHGMDPTNNTPRWISSLAVLSCSDLIATGM
jgi:WD40 repeat protein